MKAKLALISFLFLSGCLNHNPDVTYQFELPSELKDCKIFKLDGISGMNKVTLYVMKCPDGNTIISK